jgi:hypothetical protein
MSFINDKSGLVGEIAVSKAIEENFPELNKGKVSFDSIKSSQGNLIPFFLDLLVMLVDSGEVKTEFTKFIAKTDVWEKEMKESLVQTIVETYSNNVNFSGITDQFPIELDIRNVDINNQLKVSADTQIGKYFYGEATNDINTVLSKVTSTGNASYGGIFDFIFTQPGTLNVNLLPEYTNVTFEKLIRDSFNSTRILAPSVLLTKIMDSTFGSLSSVSDKSYEWFLEQRKLSTTVDKIINKETLTKTETKIYDNSFFQFTKSEMDDIEKVSKALYDGVNLANLGCGVGENFIDLKSFDDSFSKINDIRPSLVKEAVVSFTNTLINNSTVGISDENRKNVEYNIISEIWKNLTGIFTNMLITNPFVVLMFQIAENLVNGGTLDFGTNSLVKSKIDGFINLLKGPIICIVKKIYKIILIFLFRKVKKELLKIIAKRLAKEQEDQRKNYVLILKTAKNLLENVNVASLIKGQ